MALREEEKWWFEEHLHQIVEYLKPRETIRRLNQRYPNIVNSTDVDDILLKHSTPREQSEALVDLLKIRARDEVLSAFHEVVFITSPVLSTILWPNDYHILWLTPSPQHAAMVVHILQKYSEIKLHPVENGGPGILVRRSSGEVLGKNEAILTLAFPVKSELFDQVVKEMSKERANLVLLTGCCEVREGEVPIGQAVVPLSFGDSTIHCRTAERISNLYVTLQDRLKKAIWRVDCSELYDKHVYMNYCAVWLARLYIELCRKKGGQRSVWMEKQEVRIDEKGGVVCRIPEWETGELAGYVLNQTRTWSIDSTSPLGISPNPAILTSVSEIIDQFNSFPTPPQTSAPSGVLFNPLTTGISSPEASQFFKTYSELKNEEEREWFVCLGACYNHISDNPELSSYTSVSMAMEIIRMLMDITN